MFKHVRNAALFAFAGLSIVLSIVATSALAFDQGWNRLGNGLLVAAVVFIVLTVLGTAYFPLRDIREGQRRRKVREHLATLTTEGARLIRLCHETAANHSDPPDADATDWQLRSHTYLHETLGSDFAVRFETSAGLPMGTTVLMPPYSQVESFVKTRVARLTEIMRALGEQGVE